MTQRYDLHDERGHIAGYVLRETPYHAALFRSGSRASRTESPFAVALCFIIGAVILVASLAYLWTAATAG
jgi:hypothetical protein